MVAISHRGRKGGRKPELTASDVRKATVMLSNPQITKTEVARHFGITRATLNASFARAGVSADNAATQAA